MGSSSSETVRFFIFFIVATLFGHIKGRFPKRALSLVAPEPARHKQRWLFLLLFAVRYQPAVIYAPQKSWQS
jgi:hypothetical protein